MGKIAELSQQKIDATQELESLTRGWQRVQPTVTPALR